MIYTLHIINADGSTVESYMTSRSREELWGVGHNLTYEQCKAELDEAICSNGDSFDIWVTSNKHEDVPMVAQFVQTKNGLYHIKYNMDGSILSNKKIKGVIYD